MKAITSRTTVTEVCKGVVLEKLYSEEKIEYSTFYHGKLVGHHTVYKK